MLRRLARLSQPIFMLFALLAIAWFLASQWQVLRTYPWQIHWGWLSITALLTLISWAVEIAIWQNLVNALGGALPFWTAIRIWFLSAILRYIPGNIWQPLSLTLYARRHGVAPEAAITSIILFQVVIMLAVAPIFILYFTYLDTTSLAAQVVTNVPSALLWAFLIPLFVFVIRPRWLIQLLNWVLARIHRPLLTMRLTSKMLFSLIFIAFVDWLLWGCVFAAFAFAVTGGAGSTALGAAGQNTWSLAPILIGSFPIASIIGFLVLITPSGFGVREGAFYLLLNPTIAGSVVAVIALGIRVWGIFCELLAALVSAYFERRSQAATPIEAPATVTNDATLALEPPLRGAVAAPKFPGETR